MSADAPAQAPSGTVPAARPRRGGDWRRNWLFLVVNALVIGVAAVVASRWLDRPIADPEGSFLGPSWVRLPVLCGAAIVLDLLPRALWQGRLHPRRTVTAARDRLRSHWTPARLQLVVVGISCFYVIYVSYRNLKSLLPMIRDVKYDRPLRVLDRAMFGGEDPATVLHRLMGTEISAQVLSAIYLIYIPLVAVFVTVWLVWSKNIGYGWWFVTAQGIAWTLGTVSYYALPTLGPGIMYPHLVTDLTHTGVTDLMDALVYARQGFLWTDADYQGVAGFASLHTAIALLWALMAQYTVRSRAVRVTLWVNFVLTVLATIYFGWHYVADDIGGAALALFSFWLGGVVTGHRFRPGRLGERPDAVDQATPVGAGHRAGTADPVDEADRVTS
ncbi:phosphatase PAP2 family protein [Nocardioides solisilvae]|uniref:phosphatase PAP2 family protein n=1 Tax=Nocardioides solisilvae TaxID=1542435 RepID=UPI000D7445CB|nr:phosphatase PAP2 family protein [Nocardioides solisilvae]